MEYIKGDPYFALTENKIKQYPYLNKDIQADILIVGGGIDGAILNYYLSKKYDVALVDKFRFACSCTSCATALCEYQLDKYASDLENIMTEEEIVKIYNIGLKSIDLMEEFINKYGNECDFIKVPTFLYTDSSLKADKIKNEYNFRCKNKLKAEFYQESNNPFPFDIKAGLYCENGGCTFNPYLFTKQLIENSHNQDMMFENTKIDKITKENDKFIVYTNCGDVITCNKVVLATGFNWELVDKDNICERFITYTIVTKPIKDISFYNNALIQDDSQPYHYFRLLKDNRIIFGGEDIKFNNKIKKDKAEKIYEKLLKDLRKLLNRQDIEVDYKFCGSFGQTDNNLGVISSCDNLKNMYYFISCGANGIINAFWGVKLMEDIMNGKENQYEKFFKLSENR